MQPLQHALLLGRQFGDDAVQEERRLVEQPLGQFDALDHDAARDGVELRVLLGRELAAGEDDDRQVGKARILAHLLQQVEARHVGEPEVEHDAIDGLGAELGQGLAAGLDRDDVDVVMAEKLGDAHALGRVVLDHEQPLAARLACSP